MTDNQQTTCTVIKDGSRIYRSSQGGLRPLLSWLADDPDLLKDSYVIDKVVGKASAPLLAYGGVARVHGQTMSRTGADVLDAHGIEYSYDALVDHVLNKDRTDMCPMEKKVAAIDDPAQAYAALAALIMHH